MKTTEKRIRCVPVIRLCFNRSNKRIGHYADILYTIFHRTDRSNSCERSRK